MPARIRLAGSPDWKESGFVVVEEKIRVALEFGNLFVPRCALPRMEVFMQKHVVQSLYEPVGVWGARALMVRPVMPFKVQDPCLEVVPWHTTQFTRVVDEDGADSCPDRLVVLRANLVCRPP